MKSRTRHQLLYILLVSLVLPGQLVALEGTVKNHPYKLLHLTAKDATTLSKQDAVAIAQKHIKGRVLAAQLITLQDNAVYRVKILNPKGEVHLVYVDASSGHLISPR